MFKNSEEEARFKCVLQAYRSEFGCESIIVYVPRRVADAVTEDDLSQPYVIRFWKQNAYAIKVRDSSAQFTLVPED
jgi:hypothetical protein